MVAVIKVGHSIHRIFNYNENKVKEQVAACIADGNYLGDASLMGVSQRLKRLTDQLEFNPRIKRNAVHISLNFAPAESHLTDSELGEIAREYMELLGFGRQPYLVYRHYDAGHPHLHIVTTNIQSNGKGISLHHLAIRKSGPARKLLEEKYGLVRAEDQSKQDDLQAKVASVQKAMYGKSDTRRAIQLVLGAVIDQYRYTSLSELNAVLGLYNVKAERGSEDSRVFKRGGLLYRVLDDKGLPVGVPIKASSFATPATLSVLESKFSANAEVRTGFKPRVKNAIDFALLNGSIPLKNLAAELQRQGIATIFRQNEEGRLYGLTFIDHVTRCVFNGSDLGKPYSAKAIQERCGVKELPQPVTTQQVAKDITDRGLSESARKFHDKPASKHDSAAPLDQLLRTEQTPEMTPGAHKRKRRKKRKSSNN